MQAVRIKLHQTSANYRREGSVDNKMTYPLPPLSTVIGALHKACGYTTYHPMDVSIQGKYESMHREPYRDYCFLNSTMDDRGILVKMKNPNQLSNAFTKVAAAKKAQGNSFRYNQTIDVFNAELLKEYQSLLDQRDQLAAEKKEKLKPALDKIKAKKDAIKALKKECDKKSAAYLSYDQEEKELKAQEKTIKNQFKEYEEKTYKKPWEQFRVLVTSLKYYEILNEIDLVIHIKADEQVLKDILEHIYAFQALGRSEDFVDVKEVMMIELSEKKEEVEITSDWSAYLDIQLIRNEQIFTKSKDHRLYYGTKYMLPKNYDTEAAKTGKRIFERKKALYVSQYAIEETAPENNLYHDGTYIVNFL